jgi:hypothetical protein
MESRLRKTTKPPVITGSDRFGDGLYKNAGIAVKEIYVKRRHHKPSAAAGIDETPGKAVVFETMKVPYDRRPAGY